MMGNQGEVIYGIAVSSSSLLFAIFVLSGFLMLAILVSMMRIYKKAGKPAISAIIPIWSQIVMFQIVDIPFWWIFIPIANVIYMIKAYIMLAKKFGKSVGFGIGMIFLPMIFIPLLSFYDYVGDEEKVIEEVYNPFNETNVTQVMPSAPIEDNNAIEVPAMPEDNGVINNVSNDEANVLEPSSVVSLPKEEVVEQNIVTADDEGVSNLNIPVVEEIVDNSIEPVEEQIIEPVIETKNINENPTVQDIETLLNKSDEPQNIAFGSVPQNTVAPVQEEVVEELNAMEDINLDKNILETTVIDSLDNNISNQEDVIEMPEMAAKVCPACGVSLAEDVKFCTSCGTQL